MSAASRLITYDDSLLLPEDKCEEIVKGELRKMPPPGLRHARFIEKLALILLNQLPAGQFEVLASASGQVIRKEPFTYRVPDLGVYLRADLRDDHYVWAVPQLLIEVVSPAHRKGDLTELVEDYLCLRVPEVWLVEMDQRRVRRLLLGDEVFREEVIGEGSIAPARLQDGVLVKLAELWNY